MKLSFKVEENSRNVHTVRMNNVKKGWEQWFLISSDRHWDNPKSKQDLQRKHLDQAVARNAGIFDFGDLFCAMQGKYDPRSEKKDIRSEHKEGDYLDALVNTATKFFAPYAKNIIVVSPGNHETAIQKRHETNLTKRLVSSLNDKTGSKIRVGGYSGWIRFLFNTRRDSRRLYYHHGYGGGGPVTRGVIQTNRMAVYLPDADFVASGHVHEEWVVPIPRARLSDCGVPYLDEQVHIKIPTYKEEFNDGIGGYHVENGRPPKPIGAVWLRFYYDNGLQSEFHRAK